MPREALRQNLTKLHAELASAEELDEDVRALLRQVAGDIEEVLGDQSASPHSLQNRLEEATAKFEADHPRLANIIGELADTLSKLGV